MTQTVRNVHREGRIEPVRIYEGVWHFSHAFLYNVQGLHESAAVLGNILKLHTHIILKTNLMPSTYCCLHLTAFVNHLLILVYFYKNQVLCLGVFEIIIFLP